MIARVKKVIYGFFYLFIFLVIFSLIFFNSLFKKEPTCFDGIKNQNEEDIDCGGVCVDCVIKNSKNLIFEKNPKIFKSKNNEILLSLVSIKNPNENLIAKPLYYKINFYDQENKFVDSLEGKVNIYPLELKYLTFRYMGSKYNIERISRLEILIEKIEWVKEINFLVPNILLSEEPKISFEDGNVVISGKISNESAFNGARVKIIGILEDKYRDPIFLGETLSDFIGSNESYNFKVFIPQHLVFDKALEEKDIENLNATILLSLEY